MNSSNKSERSKRTYRIENTSITTMTTVVSNLFVKCPDGQTICLPDVDTAVETPSSIKRRIAQRWNPAAAAAAPSDTSINAQHHRYCEPVAVVALLVQFLTLLGAVGKLEDDMYLTYQGKPLADTAPNTSAANNLAQYNIVQNNATIHAAVRVRGGCFMVSLSLLCVIVGGKYGSFLFHHCMTSISLPLIEGYPLSLC